MFTSTCWGKQKSDSHIKKYELNTKQLNFHSVSCKNDVLSNDTKLFVKWTLLSCMCKRERVDDLYLSFLGAILRISLEPSSVLPLRTWVKVKGVRISMKHMAC